MIADDERDIIEMLEYALNKEGYHVITAEDGAETIKKAEAHKPDIILLDIMMPKMDGIEVCRTLRSKPGFENTIIIILTARGEEYSEVAGFDAGADDYVTKPVKAPLPHEPPQRLAAPRPESRAGPPVPSPTHH